MAIDNCLPHARGGVSVHPVVGLCAIQSSPRPWGCFHPRHLPHSPGKVFPTPVGVFPADVETTLTTPSLPHARGGVSNVDDIFSFADTSSPRPWGCFRAAGGYQGQPGVFPTPVGVFPPVSVHTASTT